METELQITIITLGFNVLIFLGQKWLNRNKEKAEIKKDASMVSNTDSQTLINFTEMVEHLQILLGAQIEKNRLRDDEISSLKNLMEELSDKNEALTESDEEMKNAIDLLTKQNNVQKELIESLKAVIVSEQVDKNRLREGIKRLIAQMKKAGLEPAFNLN